MTSNAVAWRSAVQEEVITASTGMAQGTFGELLQGALPTEQEKQGQGDFLVTLPISAYAHAYFRANPHTSSVTIWPEQRWKARQCATQVLDHLGFQGGGTCVLSGNLPIGKGLASSSADLVATVRAVSGALGVRLKQSEIARLVGNIEPTDGVMYQGCVAYHHKRSELLFPLGPLPELAILAIDSDRTLDTIEYNKKLLPFQEEEKEHYQDLLHQLKHAVLEKDLWAIGEVSTRSAELNQPRNPHPHWPRLRELRDALRLPGVVATHSGTMLGLLLDPQAPDFCQTIEQLREQLQAQGLRLSLFDNFSYPCLECSS